MRHILQEQKQSGNTNASDWTNMKRDFIWKPSEWIYALLSPCSCPRSNNNWKKPFHYSCKCVMNHILDKSVVNSSESNENFFQREAMNFGKFSQLHLWNKISVEAGSPHCDHMVKQWPETMFSKLATFPNTHWVPPPKVKFLLKYIVVKGNFKMTLRKSSVNTITLIK